MPAGFGVYDGGRSTAAEEQVLQRVPLTRRPRTISPGARPSQCKRLEAAGALDSPDISRRSSPPTPRPRRRRPATLHFDLFDDSGRSKAVVRIYEKGSPLATLSSPMAFAIGTRRSASRGRSRRSPAAGSSASASSPPTRPGTAASPPAHRSSASARCCPWVKDPGPSSRCWRRTTYGTRAVKSPAISLEECHRLGAFTHSRR